MKISKNKKMRFFLMSQGSFNPKIRFLGQKVCPVARRQTHTHESDYCGHPFRVSGVFPSTNHQGSAQYRHQIYLNIFLDSLCLNDTITKLCKLNVTIYFTSTSIGFPPQIITYLANCMPKTSTLIIYDFFFYVFSLCTPESFDL